MSARDQILAALRTGRRAPPQGAAAPLPPLPDANLVAAFANGARAAGATLETVAAIEDVPQRVCAYLAAVPLPLRLHVPAGSPLRTLGWHEMPGLQLDSARPALNDAAIAQADWGIAETGTLVFASGALPSLWHFLPGAEIAILPMTQIRGRIEDVAAEIGAHMPASLNLVTGPSRTGDIEQMMERGAHGPRRVHIIIVG